MNSTQAENKTRPPARDSRRLGDLLRWSCDTLGIAVNPFRIARVFLPCAGKAGQGRDMCVGAICADRTEVNGPSGQSRGSALSPDRRPEGRWS